MIHDKGWLDQLLLTIFLKEEVDDIALCMTFFKFDVVLFGKCLGSFITFYGIKINTCVFLDGIVHGQTCKWLTEIKLDPVVCELCTAAYLFCQITEHALCQLHHAFIICICLI